MIMCKRDSLSSPMSLLSVTNRSLPKSILAPLQIAISFFFDDFVSATHLFKPAKDNAPDGSKIERVSPNVSFMAAQISSLVTTTISSTKFLQILYVSSPARPTAVPSANKFGSVMVTN
eukprot:NODE_315_length_9989_cov_0.656825.p7 type:complete len:118 gc:universal NODE_315_length_9989_cov_0.656825:9631-9984(+)